MKHTDTGFEHSPRGVRGNFGPMAARTGVAFRFSTPAALGLIMHALCAEYQCRIAAMVPAAAPKQCMHAARQGDL